MAIQNTPFSREPFRGRARRLSAAMLSGLLACTVAASAFAQTGPDASSCGDDEAVEGRPLLTWTQIADASAQTTGRTLELRFENTDDEPVDVEIRLVADAGGPRHKSKRLRRRDVAAGAAATFEVEIDDLGLRTDAMAFAGQILALARVESASRCTGGACDPLRPDAGSDPDSNDDASEPRPVSGPGPTFVSAPAVYFHPAGTPGTFEIYGSGVLASRYAGGDLSSATAAEDGVSLLRVGGGGKSTHRKKHLAEMNVKTWDDDSATASAPPLLGPMALTSNNLGVCVKWEIGLQDHGRTITKGGVKITEDYWSGGGQFAGNGLKAPGVGPTGYGQMIVTARGVRIRVRKGDYQAELNTHPRTGCVSFSGAGAGQYEVTVLTDHYDERGNRMLYRDKDLGPLAPFAFKEVVTLKPGKVGVVHAGDFTPEATLAAVSGFAMYRTTFGVTDKLMILENVNTCGDDDLGVPNNNGGANSSAHYISSGLEHGIAYVRIHDGTGPGCSPSDHRKWKFLISHEIGHAWQLLNQGVFEPDCSMELADAEESVCTPTETGYHLRSLEFSCIGAREGMAHFYATSVWNSPASDTAVFTWFLNPEDVEGNDAGTSGGRLYNTCSTPNKCGRGTVQDWLRFYWDWHTPWVPGGKPHPFATTQAYGNAVNDDGTYRENYYQKLDEATDAIPSLVPFKDSWDQWAEYDGIRSWPVTFSCNFPDYPTCDFPNPFDGEGQPGCPCADVAHTLNESQFGDDGYYPDGTASYAFHGLPGTGQFCDDSVLGAGGEAVCNARAGDGAPLCQVCGEDTMLACACSTDAECQALGDSTLVCWGGEDQSWPGVARGRCMPAADTPTGKSVLDENPWICLESCTSRGGGDPDRFVCMYDQREYAPMSHAQCVDVVGCTAPAGWCEQSGSLCDTEQVCAIEYDDCCVAECTSDQDCHDLGFSTNYVCDGLGLPGFCVPPGCEFPEADQEFCDMFR